MRKVLDQGGLQAGMSDVHGLGDVTTAEAFHEALAPGLAVWLTFSNQAYLHFAQNWYLSVKKIGKHRQVVVAALDAPTLRIWRSLRVPVLDYSTSFGDTSDFRGIGADQARFRRMGAMKVAAFLQLLQLGRSVLVSDVDTVWVADPQPFFDKVSKNVDVGVTSDCLSREADENKDGRNRRFHPNGVWFCGHNPGNTFGATFNTGVLYLTPTEQVRHLASPPVRLAHGTHRLTRRTLRTSPCTCTCTRHFAHAHAHDVLHMHMHTSSCPSRPRRSPLAGATCCLPPPRTGTWRTSAASTSSS